MTAVYPASPVKRSRRTNAELALIDDAIIAAAAEEPPITLRGVYYRVVSAGAVEKTLAAYDLVGRELLKLRRDGRVPYSSITDGTRWVVRPTTWSRLDRMLDAAASSYRRMLWLDQDADVHVFTEKDAIVGVIDPVTRQWDVPLGVLRGYASESFCWSIAESLRGNTWPTYMYQLGDHDPSGLDAWRAFTERVTGFLEPSGVHYDDRGNEGRYYGGGGEIYFERLAVTEDQIGELGLPTRPTKASDSRAGNFRGESVEVDAIRPAVLRQIVEDAITQHIDETSLAVTRSVEESERELLTRMHGDYQAEIEELNDGDGEP
jgi:hypothetical protein